MGTDVEFYFDFSSPNAYFGYVQMGRLRAELGFELDVKPVFLGAIMNELETTPPGLQNRPKSDYLLMDLRRWATFYDISFTFPDDFPVDSLGALRGYLVLEDDRPEVLDSYVESVFRAVWCDNRDPSDPSVLRECLPEGIEEDRFSERIDTDEVKEELKRRTDEALDRGVFGCPMIYVDEEPFWGKDRMELVEAQLRESED